MKVWNTTWKVFFIIGIILGYLAASFLFYFRNEIGKKENFKSFFYYLNPLVNYEN